MAKKSKKKCHYRKPEKFYILGSSNNTITDTLSTFCLPPINKSKGGGNCRIGYPFNYLNQALPIDRSGIYCILLSFNGVLRYEHQITSLNKTFVKRVLQCIQALSSYSLNVRKNLMIGLPLLRHDSSLFPTQLAEIKKLEKKLTAKNIFFFNILDQIPEHIRQNDFFELRKKNGITYYDKVHYSYSVKKITAQVTAKALEEFYKSR